MCGDVNFDEAKNVASFITPVPGTQKERERKKVRKKERGGVLMGAQEGWGR